MRNPEKCRAWFRARYHRRRAEYFEGKSCVKCGGTTDLEMDHIDPSQKVDHKIWGWSKERREAEQAKCQVLCKDCHRQKSVDEGSVGAITHGTRNRYRADVLSVESGTTRECGDGERPRQHAARNGQVVKEIDTDEGQIAAWNELWRILLSSESPLSVEKHPDIVPRKPRPTQDGPRRIPISREERHG